MATAAARPLRADARRNRDAIVAAAQEVYAEFGDQAQVDDVARRAGVGVGTVYRHFPTKDALTAELISRKFTTIAEHVAKWLDADVEPWDAFVGMVTEATANMANDVAQQKLMWTMTPDALALAADARNRVHELAGELIRRAHESGDMRRDFDASHMPFLMCGLGNMIAMHVPEAPPDTWRKLLDVVLDGLRAERATSRD